jgi:hypothetical protein
MILAVHRASTRQEAIVNAGAAGVETCSIIDTTYAVGVWGRPGALWAPSPANLLFRPSEATLSPRSGEMRFLGGLAARQTSLRETTA